MTDERSMFDATAPLPDRVAELEFLVDQLYTNRVRYTPRHGHRLWSQCAVCGIDARIEGPPYGPPAPFGGTFNGNQGRVLCGLHWWLLVAHVWDFYGIPFDPADPALGLSPKAIEALTAARATQSKETR